MKTSKMTKFNVNLTEILANFSTNLTSTNLKITKQLIKKIDNDYEKSGRVFDMVPNNEKLFTSFIYTFQKTNGVPFHISKSVFDFIYEFKIIKSMINETSYTTIDLYFDDIEDIVVFGIKEKYLKGSEIDVYLSNGVLNMNSIDKLKILELDLQNECCIITTESFIRQLF